MDPMYRVQVVGSQLAIQWLRVKRSEYISVAACMALKQSCDSAIAERAFLVTF